MTQQQCTVQGQGQGPLGQTACAEAIKAAVRELIVGRYLVMGPGAHRFTRMATAAVPVEQQTIHPFDHLLQRICERHAEVAAKGASGHDGGK